MKVDPERDSVAVDGVTVTAQPPKCYLMLNKPRGYVTTLSDERGRPTAAELVRGCGVRVWPIGRLDMYSEGLLLFTNDGAFTQLLEHPKGDVEKEYLVRVDHCDKKALQILRGPISLDGRRLAPAQVELVSRETDSALLRFVIHEGKNRQIRRMCAAFGYEVKKLKRIRIMDLTLHGLKPGQYREIELSELGLREEDMEADKQ